MTHPGAADSESRRDEASPPVAGDAVHELYERLHDLARQWFARQPSDHTLQPTALVHEVYLRLVEQDPAQWASRTHVYAIAATAMRQVLIDHARRRAASKRGRSWKRVTLAGAAESASATEVDLVALADAMERLEAMNARQCRIVELRYLAGLSVDETAEAIGVSARTVKLDWRMARAWLMRELSEES